MEALTVIMQRFFYGLVSGCIISFFILLNFHVLNQTMLLPAQLDFIRSMAASYNFSILIFFITSILLGIILEGAFELCFTCYNNLNDKKIYTKSGKRKLLPFLLWHISYRVSVVETCKSSYINKEKQACTKQQRKNPIYPFMSDSGIYKTDDALSMCEKYVEQRSKASGITRYKEMAFVFQLARFSFLCVSFLSFVMGITVFALRNICTNDAIQPLLHLYILCFVVSTVLFLALAPMAIAAAKRHINEVGRWYRTIKLIEDEQIKTRN